MTPEEKLERANRAEKLLNDPLLIEAFDSVRNSIIKTIESAPIRDHEGVHECLLMLKLLPGVRSYLKQALNDGKVVIAALEQRRQLTPAEFTANYR